MWQFSQLLWVALGGALGACGRFMVSAWMNNRIDSSFPWGTFTVNVLGSTLFGILFVVIFSLTNLKEPLRLMILVGFMGAFTTFSTFSFESIRLVEEGQWLMAGTNVVGNALCCLLGVWAGMGVTRMLM